MVESTVDPTAAVVLPTTLPTVEAVELTAPPSSPPLPAELAEVLERAEPLALLPNKSSLPFALALVRAAVIELMVAGTRYRQGNEGEFLLRGP
ncbi:MAG: hypothetical protein M3539_13380 [Acidobacteriota bacterium]|nr:hypothetical protein [Acidobacteriota bacterium]